MVAPDREDTHRVGTTEKRRVQIGRADGAIVGPPEPPPIY
jgi:hypothetical protein